MPVKRFVNLDLLRIILMMMIVSLHYFGHGGGRMTVSRLVYNDFIAQGVSVLCWCAVNTFFMLSGYLTSSKEDEITIKYCFNRVLKIWVKVFIISALVYITAFSTGLISYSSNLIFPMICPIFSNRYWFITVFVLMSAIWPFIVKAYSRLTNNEIMVLVGILFFFDSIQTTLGQNGFGEYGVGFLHAFTVMTIGYAMRNVPKRMNFNKLDSLSIYVFSCVMMALIAFVEKRVYGSDNAKIMYYNSPLCITAAIGLLSFFRSLKIESVTISKVAPFVLGIYLINDHPIVREHVWKEVLHCPDYYNSPYMVLHYLGSLIGFVLLGFFIDRLVSAFLQKISHKKIKYA